MFKRRRIKTIDKYQRTKDRKKDEKKPKKKPVDLEKKDKWTK